MRVVAVALVLCVASTAAHAQPSPGDEAEARRLFEEANELVDRGDSQAALARYRAAYELVPRPSLLFNIGVVLLSLGRDAEAANAFAELIAHPQADPDHYARATKELAELDERLGRLAIDVGVPGAFVGLDGAAIGVAPLRGTLRVVPGLHVVAVQWTEDGGRKTVVIDVVAGARRVARVPASARPDAPTREAPAVATITARSRAPVTDASPTKLPRPATQPARPARWHPFVRVDVDARRTGAVAAPGLALDVGAHARVAGSALVGGNAGFELAARLAIGSGWLQPTVTAAIPVFFADGARAGGRAAIGVSVRLPARLAFTADVGGAYAFSVPDDTDRAVGLVSIGLEVGL